MLFFYKYSRKFRITSNYKLLILLLVKTNILFRILASNKINSCFVNKTYNEPFTAILKGVNEKKKLLS